MWEIATKQLPFSQYKFNYQVLDAVKAGERPSIPNNCLPMLKSLIIECWAQDPVQRPSFGEIQHRLAEELARIS